MSRDSAFVLICRPGLVGAARQLAAVMMLAIVVIGADTFRCAHDGQIGPAYSMSEPRLACLARASKFLAGAYIIIALGIVATSGLGIAESAERIRAASRQLSPHEPERTSKALGATLCIGAAGFALLAWQPAPVAMEQLFEPPLWRTAVARSWSATLSVAVAAVGVSARSALKALTH